MTQTCRSPPLSRGRGTTSRTADKTQKPLGRRTRKQSHLVHDERSRGVTASVNEVFQILALDDLAGRVARVRGDDDLETLRHDVALDLLQVQAVLLLLIESNGSGNERAVSIGC